MDVDWYVEDPQTKYDLQVDLDKAALHGISAADVTRTSRSAWPGRKRACCILPNRARTCPSWYGSAAPPAAASTSLDELKLPTGGGGQVSLREVTNPVRRRSTRAAIARTCKRSPTLWAMSPARRRARSTPL